MPSPVAPLRRLILVSAVLLAGGCEEPPVLDPIAERYVKLVLAVAVHDPDYVDAYYGPPEWRAAVVAESLGLDSIAPRVQRLADDVAAVDVPEADTLLTLRRRYLLRQSQAMVFRVAMLRGTRPGFDEEAVALYDAAPPIHDEGYFQGLLARLDSVLPPGRGTVTGRLERYRSRFVVPPARLDAVFRAAIEACRTRTAAHLALPDSERFTIEYVRDKPWSGYNWYQGNFASVIQVNTDLPIFIDRALDLACHEGYPGHHVYNAMLEDTLVRGRGWVEYSVFPLFSPQSLIAEGTANYGITMAFPGQERVAFERDVLYPLAGLDGREAERYAHVMALAGALTYAGNEAARRWLDGRADSAGAVRWLETYALMSPERARQRLRFIARYRSYVINYNLGRDLVAAYVERAGATPEARWAAFTALLRSPRLPSGL